MTDLYYTWADGGGFGTPSAPLKAQQGENAGATTRVSNHYHLIVDDGENSPVRHG